MNESGLWLKKKNVHCICNWVGINYHYVASSFSMNLWSEDALPMEGFLTTFFWFWAVLSTGVVVVVVGVEAANSVPVVFGVDDALVSSDIMVILIQL